MPKQLRLPHLRVSSLPFVVRRKSVRRAALRQIRAKAAELATSDALKCRGFRVRALIEDQVLVAELGKRSRAAGRSIRRKTGQPAAAAFAATLEGRRVHRLIDQLSERIAETEESLLCG